MEVMRTRRDPERDPSAPILNAGEVLDLDTTLRAYTSNGAYLLHQEGETGAIVVGKMADLVVVDRDFTAGEPAVMSEVRPVMTMLGGRIVFSAL